MLLKAIGASQRFQMILDRVVTRAGGFLPVDRCDLTWW